MNQNQTCCFFGHRDIIETTQLKENLKSIIENLIINKNVDTFLLGSKSDFNSLCYDVVTELKKAFPHIRRIYVRAEFPFIDDDYRDYLLKRYEETYYPEKILNAGKAAYVERNCEMIDKSNFCVVYYDENYTPCRKSLKSGTKIAYNYAEKKENQIINLYNKKEACRFTLFASQPNSNITNVARDKITQTPIRQKNILPN